MQGFSNFNVKIRFKSLKVLQGNSSESIFFFFCPITPGCWGRPAGHRGQMLRSVEPGQWNICFFIYLSEQHQSGQGPLPLTLRCEILSGHEKPGGSLTPL